MCTGTVWSWRWRFVSSSAARRPRSTADDTWTTENGLPQNGIRAITQTPDGYLWFTTFDGLVRFDGVQFTTFGTGNTKGIKAADAALYRAKADGRNRIHS